MEELRRRIEECWEAGMPEPGPVEEAISLLDRGELRVAEPRDGGWVVNEWAKKAILLYFKLRKVEPMDAGPLHFLDKIPLKRDYAERGVESFRPGRRYGSFSVGGVVLMPRLRATSAPGSGRGRWWTPGRQSARARQIGADVHLAGGVGIGGVLEPPQVCTIVEDGAFVGSRCIVTEGVRIGAQSGARRQSR